MNSFLAVMDIKYLQTDKGTRAYVYVYEAFRWMPIKVSEASELILSGRARLVVE
jgi:hypothetical protein